MDEERYERWRRRRMERQGVSEEEKKPRRGVSPDNERNRLTGTTTITHDNTISLPRDSTPTEWHIACNTLGSR